MGMVICVVFPYPLKPQGVNAGAANATLQLVGALTAVGYHVSVYHPGDLHEEYVDSRGSFITYAANETFKIKCDSLIAVFFDNKTSELERFHVVPACKRAVFYHNAVFNVNDRRLMTFFKTWPDVMFVVSQHSANEARKAGLPDCVVIKNGASFSEQENSGAHSLRGASVYLFVGALVKAKGVDRLIPAFIEFAEDKPEVSLRVVGSSKIWFRDQPDFIAEGAPQIEFLGELVGEQILGQYLEASFILLPSEMEASPLSIIDGMACGCIPIVSNVGGLGELVTHGQTGLVVPEVTIEGILGSLNASWALNHEQRKEMSQRATTSVEDRTWTSAGVSTISALNSAPRRKRWLFRS